MEGDRMKMRFGRGTVEENLERAVAEGRLERLPDGSYMPRQKGEAFNYLYVKIVHKKDCRFLDFIFHNAYDQAAVPYGCRNCYKVKIAPPNFKGLIALREILEEAPHHSKCGVDFFNPNSQDFYAGLLYLDGLDEARAAYREMRVIVDSHPDLGNSVQMTIKRGCSHFEAVCGPSDRWVFCNGMAELEEGLKALFQMPSDNTDYRQRRMASMINWLQFAYNLKDDTYLAFTGGKPLHKPTVSYPPE